MLNLHKAIRTLQAMLAPDSPVLKALQISDSTYDFNDVEMLHWVLGYLKSVGTTTNRPDET